MFFDRSDLPPDTSPAPAATTRSESTRMIAKAIRPHELTEATQLGWQLVRVFEGAQRVHIEKQLLQQSHHGPTGWIPDKYEIQMFLVTEPLFLVEKPADTLDREHALALQIEALNDACQTLRKQLEALPEIQESYAQCDKRCEAAIAERDVARKRVNELTDLADRLGSELNKMRREIGEGRWREIGGWMGESGPK